MDLDRLSALGQFGWKNTLTQEAMRFDEALEPTRVIEIHRSGLIVAPDVAAQKEFVLGGRWFNLPADERPTVGDWILVNPETRAVETLLERMSLIKRRSPSGEVQPIAANIDTAFIVTSCNSDFSLARLERYLAVVRQDGIQPVVVLTKSDLSDDPESFREQTQSLGGNLVVELVNALVEEDLSPLASWCGSGRSIALLGSSGVGKSTIVNTLAGSALQDTQASREGDNKGRHTTTRRSLFRLPTGGVILDSPGMREFQITDADSGVHAVFEDIEELALDCKFGDCAHASEPGCVVRDAIESGQLEERRLQSYFKLLREDRNNTETIVERHARARDFGKKVKAHVHTKLKPRRG